MHAFQLVGIDHAPFEHLFKLTDGQLGEFGAVRRIATASTGFPCRVSLEDADTGDELLLLPYAHHPVESPYRASGPIFVRRGARQRTLPIGEVPTYVTRRVISLRAYDAAHMMVDAAVCEGTLVATELQRFLDNDDVAYIHLHNAKQGCFSCRVDRMQVQALSEETQSCV
jgi:hypothetical protein